MTCARLRGSDSFGIVLGGLVRSHVERASDLRHPSTGTSYVMHELQIVRQTSGRGAEDLIEEHAWGRWIVIIVFLLPEATYCGISKPYRKLKSHGIT